MYESEPSFLLSFTCSDTIFRAVAAERTMSEGALVSTKFMSPANVGRSLRGNLRGMQRLTKGCATYETCIISQEDTHSVQT